MSRFSRWFALLAICTSWLAGSSSYGQQDNNPLRDAPAARVSRRPEFQRNPYVPEPAPAASPIAPAGSPIAAPAANPNPPAAPTGSLPPVGTQSPPLTTVPPPATDTPPNAATPPNGSAPPATGKSKVEELLQVVQKSSELDETTKAELTKRYKAAVDWWTAADRDATALARYKTEFQSAPQATQSVRAALAAPAPEPEAGFPPGSTLQQMEHLLSETAAAHKAIEQDLAAKEEALRKRAERKSELAKAIESARQELDDARKQLANPPDNGDSAELAAARKLELEARVAAADNRLASLKAESDWHESRAELLPLQRDLAKRQRDLSAKNVDWLQRRFAAAKKSESEHEAAEAQRRLATAHPAVRKLAERNATLAEEYKALAESIAKVTKEVGETDKRVADLQKDFDDLAEKVRFAGHSASIGLMLRKKRDELPSIYDCERRVRFVASEMSRANLARMERSDEREPLTDIDAAVQATVVGLDADLVKSYGAYLEPTVGELLEKKRELLYKLKNDYDSYLTDLSELEVSQRKLIEQTGELGQYIDEHVLWIRSADTVGLSDLRDAGLGFVQLASPGQWGELATRCGLDAAQQPLMIFGVTVLAVALIVLHQRLRKRMRELCASTLGSASLRFWPTAEGILLAAAMATTWPLILSFIGWRMISAEGSPDLGRALGGGLQLCAVLLWLSEFTRQICKPGTIGEVHFGWSQHNLGIVRKNLRRLVVVGVPLVLLIVVAHRYQDGQWSSSLGRLSFIVAMGLLAACMYTLLLGKDNLLRELMASDPNNWLARLRYLIGVVALGLPIGLAVLSIVGFHYSAQQLATRLEITLAMVIGLVLMHAIASRWFLIKRRNLAIEQLRQRRAAEADANTSASTPIAVPIEEDRDLSSIHEQLRYLLRSAIVVLLFGSAWMIWSDVLPALKALDGYTLWWSSTEVSEMRKNLDGELEPKTIRNHFPITLRHALLAVLLLAGTLFVGRNLPALLEITVLDRLPMDKGARHAICVLLRYLVALVGALLACRTLSINWSSVQWLAAGMTVGLGFGLQEIFANFISGLILLFERPIRVGDVITLGDITGTVSNIRIRATTVTNWDRKELIVPNKELITGRLLNWTLTDTTNRIVITVGVAYKSDTRRAHEIILASAVEHPNVLEDPAPNVTFDAFGTSSLNFVLRCYIAAMDTRLITIHQLHETIHDRFNEAGIEIAFPQMDLHVRSVETAIQVAPPDDSSAKAA